MFRANNFDRLLDKATSHILMEPDWPSILQICDLIRQNDVQPKYALNALRKKLISTNPHAAMYALLVLESMVKNCGPVLHEELTTKPNCEFLHELARTTTHENVRSKLLELIQAWTFAFRKNPKHGALKDIMHIMKAEGYKFPVLRESDAMFSADTAPEWADGDVCHRCRVAFSIIQRKHHCRACGQVFCGQCTSKSTTLPKYGIEKEVRVCDSCFDQATKPVTASKTGLVKSETELPPEYLKSTLAQQNQEPPKKSEDELREEEELQLALALSQSEAEAKEKEKFKITSSLHTNIKAEPAVRTPTPTEEATNPELARYLNRSYWESFQSNESTEQTTPASPSAPAMAPIQNAENKVKKENGIADNDLEDFISTLKSQVEVFINRMKGNSSRGRSFANDTSVQTIFMNITAMHSRLLNYIQEHDDSRLHYERLQDKLTQIKDARAALDALREEHHERMRREAEEAERQRQLQMAHKLEIMRKKKQEYLQYQRQLALQRIQEQEREMHMRQEQQKQAYLMPQYGGYMGSPVHGQQFPPNSAPPGSYHSYQFQHMMPPHSASQMSGPPQGPLPSQPLPHNPAMMGPPQGFPQGPPQQTATSHNPGVPGQQQQFTPHGPPSQIMMGAGVSQVGMPPQSQGMPTQSQGMPPQSQGMPPQSQGMPPQSQGMPTQSQGMPPQSQGMPPQAQGMPPKQGEIAPNPSSMMPNRGGMVPNPGGMAPNQIGMHPSQGGMPPPNQGGIPQPGMTPGMPPHQGGIPQNQGMPQHQGQIPPQFQQGGVPPTNSQVQQNGEAQTGELISFD